MKEQIVITMPLKNAEATVGQAIASFLEQKASERDHLLLIGHDSSSDGSLKVVESFLPHPRIRLLQVNLGKAYRCRNFLNNHIRKHLPGCVLIGRLDADDVLLDAYALAQVEDIFDREDFDVLICGNKQQRNGAVLDWINRADVRLLEEHYLLQRLDAMRKGRPEAELPSCNTFIKPSVAVRYPARTSAEDHWFTVELLLQKHQLKIHVEEALLYCIYNLDGAATTENLKGRVYRKSREDLYTYFKNRMNV